MRYVAVGVVKATARYACVIHARSPFAVDAFNATLVWQSLHESVDWMDDGDVCVVHHNRLRIFQNASVNHMEPRFNLMVRTR